MKTVLLRAPVLTLSGYGVHARQVAKWLFDQEEKLNLDITTELLNWGHTGWIVDPEAEDGLAGRILQASGNSKQFYDITIQLQLPNEWNPMLGACNIGITAGVETDRCNPSWIDSINQMDLVVVPSEFTKQSFMSSGNVTTDIVVIPEAFMNAATEESKPIQLDLPTKFNFLVFGQITGNTPDNDRKNLAYTIKWLSEALANRPDVGVVVKSNIVRNTKLDRMACANMFAKLVEEVKQGPGPQFYLLHGNMKDEEVVSLYKHPSMKALISLTHGEGYGLPLLEAAACGLPVMATNWSGHLEFLKYGKFLPIEYKLSPIHESRVDNQIFIPGAMWAYPLEQDFKRKVLKFVDSPDLPKQWAKELQTKILELFSQQTISNQYSKHLDSILTK